MPSHVIYKYPIQIDGPCTLKLPRTARILTVQMQGLMACLWALHKVADEDVIDRHFQLVATGEHFEAQGCTYLGTVQPMPTLVFHLFELLR